MTEIKCNNCGKIKKHKAKGLCSACYFKQYNKKNKDRIKKYQNENKDAINEWRREHYVKTPNETAACKIIKKHHEDMKDDPESLSTEFIQNIIGRKCD